MTELTPEQFNAMMERLAKAVVVLPMIAGRIYETYPSGSYERSAADKFNAIVPKLSRIRERLIKERGTPGLTDEERATIHELAVTLQDAKAIFEETGFDFLY